MRRHWTGPFCRRCEGSFRWAYPVSAVRGFATYLHALGPVNEVPAADLLPQRSLRDSPYLYSDAEITALIEVTRSLRTPLRRATLGAPISR